MNSSYRQLFIIILLVMIASGLALTASGSESTPQGVANGRRYGGVFAEFYRGQSLEIDSLTFDVEVDPPIAQVGDIVQINLSVTNSKATPAAPVFEILLPTTLQVQSNNLSRGLSYNFQTQTINWQPVTADGATVITSIPVLVRGGNPESPEQQIGVRVLALGQSSEIQATLWVGTPPTASFTINPVRASIGQPIQLIADVEGSGPHSYVWSLGDGRIVPAKNPVVVYPSVGSYDIELQVANPLATVVQKQRVVVVPEPVAFFKVSDSTPAENQEIVFTTQSGGHQPLSYLWDFGDGSFSTDPNPVHRYPTSGLYEVTLTVRNAFGQAQNFLSLNVGQPPIADAIVPEQGIAGQPLFGQAFTDDNTLVVNWNMGDGVSYEGESIAHTYQRRGDYLVTVNAGNSFGNTTIAKLVRISGGDFLLYLPTVIYSPEQPDGTLADEAALLLNTIAFVEVDNDIVLESNSAIEGLSTTDQLLWYINEARRQADLAPVTLIQTLSSAAKNHTDDMANNLFTGHTGSDGSPPYERIARNNYREGGYAGEATAWGFRNASDAVQFWLDSPPHRAILLNPLADHVGVAQTINYNAPSVWYWTAEFASSYGSITAQMQEAGIRLNGPETASSYQFGDTVLFGWTWPFPLGSDERFELYLRSANSERKVGTIQQPVNEESPFTYGYPLNTLDLARRADTYAWLIRLENARGDVITRSEVRSMTIVGDYPTPTPIPVEPTTTQAAPIATLSPTLEPTATALPIDPTSTPAPTQPPIGEAPTFTSTPIESTITPTPIPTATFTPTPSTTPVSTATPPVIGVIDGISPTPTATQTPTP